MPFGQNTGKGTFGQGSGKGSFGKGPGKGSFGQGSGKGSFGQSSGLGAKRTSGGARKSSAGPKSAARKSAGWQSAGSAPGGLVDEAETTGPYAVSDPDGSEPGSTSGRTRRGRQGAAEGKRGDDGGAEDTDPYATARSIVLRQLTLAPKSRHQLASKLAERDVPDEVATAVLDRFEEVELIDDAEFAMMWVRSRAATRSLARSALKRELAEKGIHGDLAEDALAQVSDDEERYAAEQLVRRKHRPLASAGDRATRDKETRRLVSMLARKGYSPSLAFGVVKTVIDDVADHEHEAIDPMADNDISELDYR
ncbi:regulatory protein RecX [Arthrobacter sp. 260]|uniref:regulatory protein RecX n=1 Tax=Arthrobacter sp. 260 TaxID=2735314 RepID=UPI00320A19EE